MAEHCQAIHSTSPHSSGFLPRGFVSDEPTAAQLTYMSIASRLAGYKSTQSTRRTCRLDQESDKFRRRELGMHDPVGHKLSYLIAIGGGEPDFNLPSNTSDSTVSSLQLTATTRRKFSVLLACEFCSGQTSSGSGETSIGR
jgi:hypothetical protein